MAAGKVSSIAPRAAAFDGTGALDIARAPQPAPKLALVPDPVSPPVAAPVAAPVNAAPKAAPKLGIGNVPAVAAVRVTAKSPKEPKEPSDLKPIFWPSPVWHATAHGDSGSKSTQYDRPPLKIVTKQTPGARDKKKVGRYVAENIKALKPFYKPKVIGDIHHKWPLYLGGPDSTDNFVFLLRPAHSAWHGLLTPQTTGGVGTPYFIIN
jgi:hypothetical protein